MHVRTGSARQTEGLGKKLAKRLKGGDIVCLFGQLGSGKTTFVKGLAQGLGVRKIEVNSPSFILMRKYGGKVPLYHFDLYRIKESAELCDIGYEEFVFSNGISVIEWADRMEKLLPKKYLKINFTFIDETHRGIALSAPGKYFRDIIRRL